MKKKRRLFSVLSSIFGIGAICGLFSLIIINNDFKVQTVSADSSQVVANYDFSSITTYRGNYGNNGVNISSPQLTYFKYNIYSYLLRNRNGDDVSYSVRLTLSFNIGAKIGDNYYWYDIYTNSGKTNSTFTLTSTSFLDSDNGIILSLSRLEYARYEVVGGTTHYEINSSYAGSVTFVLLDSNDNTIATFGDVEIWFGRMSSTGLQGQEFATFMDNFTHYSSLNNRIMYPNVDFNSPYYYTVDFLDFNFVLIDTDFNSGYDIGYSTGYADGFNNGNSEGYNNGYNLGYQQGVESQQQVIQDSYNNGYSIGYSEGVNSDSTVHSIFTGILEVGMLPINFFLAIFNFEILGINLSSFISAMFSVLVTIWVVKFVLGYTGGGK